MTPVPESGPSSRGEAQSRPAASPAARASGGGDRPTPDRRPGEEYIPRPDFPEPARPQRRLFAALLLLIALATAGAVYMRVRVISGPPQPVAVPVESPAPGAR